MKLLKKIIPIILSFLITLSAFPFSASAATVSNLDFDYFEVKTSSNYYSGTPVDSTTYSGYKTCYIGSVSGTLSYFIIEDFDCGDTYNFKLSKGDSLSIELYTIPNSRYVSFTPRAVFYCVDAENTVFRYSVTGTFDRSSGKISFNLVSAYDFDEMYFEYIRFNDITLNADVSNFGFVYKGLTITTESEQSGFFSSVKEAFANLWQWLQNIIESIKEIPTKIGESLTNLGDTIKGFFTNLINNISEWFSNLIDNLTSFFSDVGSWFTTLGNNIKTFFTELGDRISNFFVSLANNISGFFEKLWNRIWWGNENGESEYNKPTIDNKLNDILDTLSGYQEQLKSTIDTISDSAEQVSAYISNGTSLVNGIIGVAGAGFTALIVFGIVFVLVRKVVGR